MKLIFKRIVVLTAASTISLLAVGCGESKVTQCNKISAIVNKAANEAQSMGKSNNPDKVGTLEQAGNSMEAYAKELEAVQVKDETLQGLQAQFVKMYRDTGKAAKSLVVAAKSKDAKGMGTSVKDLQTATSKETTLVNDFNKYCRGS